MAHADDNHVGMALAHMWGLDNAQVILDQYPNAIFVLTWAQWNAVGRVVRHGEKHCAKAVSLDGTHYIHLFDITQTDPKD
jgi:hypothetical protein